MEMVSIKLIDNCIIIIYILRKVLCPPTWRWVHCPRTWLWLHKANQRIGKLKLNYIGERFGRKRKMENYSRNES